MRKHAMQNLEDVRRKFAEDIRSTARLQNESIVAALARVPREDFLGSGPWSVQAEGAYTGPQHTPDADPRHLYRDVSVAINSDRNLYNGSPSVVASWIDHLDLRPGDHVLHIGTGTGYYTALLADCVGPTGRVLGLEVDAELAEQSGRNLARYSYVSARQGDGSDLGSETFDGILVSAGVTHPLESWIRALRPGGRMVLPLTCAFAPTLGKGFAVRVSKGEDGSLSLKTIGMVVVYSAVGIRDPAINARLSDALMRGGMTARSIRLDRHTASESCWLHLDAMCLSSS
jgi:protein-L-isoaspartate(D-aspartate) O-methyltransferase